MKPPEIEPGCALGFGFLGAPFIGALNAILVDILRGQPLSEGFDAYLGLSFFAFIFCAPLAILTMEITKIWRDGHHFGARLAGVICGVCALAFWVWLFGNRSPDGILADMPRIAGALAIPVLWSLLIPIFALCARVPRAEG